MWRSVIHSVRNLTGLKIGLPSYCPQKLTDPSRTQIFKALNLSINNGATCTNFFCDRLLRYLASALLSNEGTSNFIHDTSHKFRPGSRLFVDDVQFKRVH